MQQNDIIEPKIASQTFNRFRIVRAPQGKKWSIMPVNINNTPCSTVVRERSKSFLKKYYRVVE
jgi:hypothetical protein